MKSAIFLYEPSHVESLHKLLSFLEPDEAYDLIACDLGIEFLLEKKMLPYISARELRSRHSHEGMLHAKKLGEEIMRAPVFSQFSHKGVSLSALFVPMLQYYLVKLLYYFDIAASALERGYTRVILFQSSGEKPLAGALLETYSLNAFFDSIQTLCTLRGIALDAFELPQKRRPRSRSSRSLFVLKRALFGLYIRTQNALVSLVVPKKKMLILASEYWKNLSSLVDELPEAEIVLVDRMESLAAGLRAILRHRMRFVHGGDFIHTGGRSEIQGKAEHFVETWDHMKQENKAFSEASLRGYSLTPILEPVMKTIIAASSEVMRDIEGTFAMLQSLAPDAVLVRASVSAQTHFAVLCEVARLLRIPSIEVQHGVFSMGPETLSSNHVAEFIAEYGPLERLAWKAHEYAPRSTPIDIGSPRFDSYMRTHPPRRKEGSFTILHIAPQLTPGEWMDSYDVFSYFETLASSVREISPAHVIVKLRAGDMRSVFFEEAVKRAFSGVSYEVASREPLAELFARADAVVSCHSTAVLEALLARRPVILDATLPVHAELFPIDFGSHIESGAVVVAYQEKELSQALQKLTVPREREEQVGRAEAFMKEQYLFSDGKSSKRLADYIHSLIE